MRPTISAATVAVGGLLAAASSAYEMTASMSLKAASMKSGGKTMKLRISGLLAIAAFAVACLSGSAQSLAQNAYITNSGSNTVSVIDTTTNTVIATIPVDVDPKEGLIKGSAWG